MIEDLIRKDLLAFKGYSSARKEAKELPFVSSECAKGKTINLNANESPWDNGLNRYPEQQPLELVDALAAYYALEPDQLLITRGSDEGIDCLLRLFCQAQQDSIVICPPTFGMYEVYAQLQGALVIQAPLQGSDYVLDTSVVLAACQDNTKLVFLCSPNNPTGGSIPLSEITEVCVKLRSKAMVVVDEAYVDFSDTESTISLLAHHENLVVLRTFSKAFGLAAARVGVLLGSKKVVNWLKRVLSPYPIPIASTEAVLQLLRPEALEVIADNVKTLIEERNRLCDQLSQLKNVVKVWPSQANFVLVQFSCDVFQPCLQQGILLRDMSQKMGLSHLVRISMGTPEENNALIAVLGELA